MRPGFLTVGLETAGHRSKFNGSRFASICGVGFCILIPPAKAGALAFECQGNDNGKPMTLSVVYEGEETGKLIGKSSFGNLSLVANKKEEEAAYEGKSRKVTAIVASGTVNVLMPDGKALEACIAPKVNADDADGTLAIMSCVSSVPVGAAPVSADVFITISIDPFVYQDSAAEVRRRYPDASAALGRKLTLEALPPLSCKSTPRS